MSKQYDPTDLVGIERAKAEQAERDRNAAENEARDIRWLMGTKQGRRIVARILDWAGVFRSTFNTNSMQMAFSEGNRNLGLWLFSQIDACCPELIPVMSKERKDGK